METYQYLFDMALILITTKIFSILIKKADMPQVVGALVAGLILGPTALGLVSESDFLNRVAEMGVIVLMFTAGLETNTQELKKTGKAAFIIALCGVLIPLGGGFLLAQAFNLGTSSHAILQNVFIGVVLTATSVSITVETLKELGKLSTRSGNAILGAAIIDDVLGIIALTIITGMSGEDVNVPVVLGKITLFFLLSLAVGGVLHKRVERWMERWGKDMRRFAIISFAFCLAYSYVAEELFGVADITGAFIAGLVIANTVRVTYVASRFEILSYMFLSPVFFASIGFKVRLPAMDARLVLFALLLVAVAVLTKIIGCGVGARLCGYTNKESVRIGVGMISRGEVALIVASKGEISGLLNPMFLGPIVIMVLVTTILTPVLLKLVYRGKAKDYSELEYSTLADQYQDVKNVDLATQALIDMHHELKNPPQEEEKDSPPGEKG